MEITLSVLLLGVIGALLLVLVLDYAVSRRRAAHSSRHREFRKVATGAAITLTAILLVESFVAWPSRIPSGSMVPTLHAGNVVLVEKFAYGLHLPITHRRILQTGVPQRGDVVVFRFPGHLCQEDGHWVRSGDETCTRRGAPVRADDWIKRVVGVPGDRVSMEGSRLVINGRAVPTKSLGSYQGDARRADDRLLLAHGGEVWEEQMGAARHRIVTMAHYNVADPIPNARVPAVVPDGCYLVLGDDRNASLDSRWWGCVPESALVGRARVILFGSGGVGGRSRPLRSIDAS